MSNARRPGPGVWIPELVADCVLIYVFSSAVYEHFGWKIWLATGILWMFVQRPLHTGIIIQRTRAKCAEESRNA